MMRNTIICGDCIDVMKTMPDGCIDLTVTSPPYNLGNKHHTGNNYHSSYNDNIHEGTYQESQINMLDELYRITDDKGSLIYNHKNRIRKGVQITPYKWLLKTKWTIKQELVWFNRSQNFDKIRFYPMTERIYWLAKSPKTKLYNTINHHDVFNAKDWMPVGTKGQHKRAFPEKFVSDMLKCFPEAKTILDPYCGSGTTLKMAKKLGRNYIGIDCSEEYCQIAEKRIKEIKGE